MSFTDWVNEKKKKEEEEGKQTRSVSTPLNVESFSDWVNIKKESTQVNQDYINSFLTDAKGYLDTAESDYSKIGWGTASSAYDSRNSSWSDLNTRYNTIRMWLGDNSDNLDYETYKSLRNALENFNSGATSVLDTFKGAKDFYAQWDTEDAYNAWKTEEDERQAILNSKDLDYYVQLGKDIDNPTWKETNNKLNLFGWKPFGEAEEINNIVTFAEENKQNAYAASAQALRGGGSGNENTEIVNLINMYMTDEEKSIYNYYLGKGDTKKANEYMKQLEGVLRQRQGGAIAEQVDETAFEYVFSVVAGFDQFASGVKNLDNLIMGTEADPTTAIQYAYSQTSSNNTGFNKVANDLLNTTANMLPSILVGSVTGGVGGTVTMGLSASGNAYAEMKNLGYSDWQARGYAALVGASEAGLSYVLGGISKLGGKVSSHAVNKFVSGLDNAFGRVALTVGIKMGAEGLEEGIQTVIEPAFKALVTGEDYEAAEWSDIFYSAFLGALSSGTFDGVPTVVGTSIANVKAKKKYGDGSALVNEALGVATEGSELEARANKYKGKLDGGKSLSGQQINLLNEAIASNDTNIIKKAAKERLAELGETGDIDKIADVIAKIRTGEKITRAERNLLTNSKYGRRVSTELNPNIIAAGTHDTAWAENIGTRRVNTQAYNKELYELAAQISGSNTTPLSKLSDKEITDVSGKVSDSGTTKNTSTGEDVIINQDNAIAKTKMVNGERVVYYNTDKGVVASTDIKYATKGEGLLYEAFVDLNPAFANAVIKNYDGSVPIETYVKGMREGIVVYGMHNFQAVGKDISGASHLAELSKADQDFALKLGRAYAKADAKKADNNLHKAIKNASDKAEASGGTSTSKTQKKGRVSFENGAKLKTKAQRRVAALAKHLASAIGIDIVFYDATISGTPGSDSNGYYDPDTDTIHLDLQNAKDDAKTIAFTLSHELVHFIKKNSPSKFNTFANFLMEQYAEHGVDTSKILSNKMAELGTTDADFAYEEMICDACETMLLDSNAVVKLMELRKQDLGLFETIKLHILKLLNKIRDMYKSLGLEPASDEAKALLKMEDVLSKIHTMFEDALVDATQNYQAVAELNTESVSVTEDGTIRMQMKQYQQTGRATLLKYLREQYGDENANDLILTIDNIYDVMKEIKNDEALSVFSNWQDTEIELDEDGHPIFTTSINNGDYELNQDFSRVCKKRRQLDLVLNMLAEDPAFEASHLTKQDFVKINKAIKSHGFEIACALCFVDSKRFRQAEWADSFANTWNDILNAVVVDGSKLTPFNFATKNPNLTDDGIEIDTSRSVTYRKWSDGKEDVKNRRTYDNFDQMLSKADDGKWLEGNANVRTIATLIRDNPELRHTFRGADIIASKGFDTIQRLAPGIRGILDGWGGSSVPKPSSNDASYDSSIINMSGYNKETAYAMGGVRMNSFSDFMAHMFFDYCQAFADLSAKELPSQAYTKELIYVRLFGRSGQKINMSGIAAIRDDALPTTAGKNVTKAEAEANEKIEKMIAGLDVSRLLEHLNKDIHQLTEADVEQFLDMCDYVWADESINMKHATLLQTGILYDKISESKVEECYELIKAGEIEQALNVAGKENVDAEYAKNCGTIVVGVSDAHIRKLLRDPTVRMVIPYHKSGLNPIIARELRISAYNDYTLTQTTGVKRKGAKASEKIGSKAIKDAYGLKDFSFYDWFGKTIDGKLYDGKATADKYLEWCEKGYYDEKVGDYVYYTTKGDGYILAKDFHKKASIVPKFGAFMGEENYYKVLEDFDCYDTITGEHSAQGAVDFLRNGLPSDYKDVLVGALKEEQKVQDDFKDHLDNKGLRDEVMEIVKAHGYVPSEMIQTLNNIADAVGIDNVTGTTELYTDVENTLKIKKQKKKTSDNTYEAIGKEILYYEEGDLAPDLTLVETINDRTGKKEVTIKHYGQKPKDYVPKKIAYCYKLFEQHPDGSLHALFAGAKNAVPIGEWRYAQGFPRNDAGVAGMDLRERYGWHLSAGLPSAPHLMSSKYFERGYPTKGQYGHPKNSKRVWVRMAYDASTDFNSVADSTGSQNDIYGLIPFGGYYAFKENNQSEWVISSAVKIDKILEEEERQQILKDAGYDEYEAWRLKYQPTPEERAARELANKERAKAKAKAKKLGLPSELSESTKAMRDSIKSRIIDNPELGKGIKKQAKKSSMSNSVFTEEEMLNIRKNVVSRFNLKGINGFAQVQRNVLNTLRANGFFESNGERKVVIKENGMVVTINRGSIEETFGSGNKYESIPATFKILKLATIEQIPNIIENATVVDENKTNKYRDGKNKAFTYLSGTATVEGKSIPVRVTLKISKEKNKFWVHYVDVIKNADDIFGLGANNASPTDSKLSSAENSVTQNEPIVKKQLKKSSDREIQPITETEYEALKKHFGVTNNFNVAGYLLPDGRMLDFSGKHWGDTTSRSRQVDHRDAQEVLERGNNGINDMVDMIGSGCIRLMPETGGINLAVYPNEKQRRVLSIYIKQMLATEGQVIIDYDAVGGDTVYSKIYEKYASSSQILSDIRNYFNGARQSDLMSFHTAFQKKQVTNRTLLANALDSIAESDIEKNKLTQYKQKIALIESEQAKLAEIREKANELRFTKGRTPTETKQMRDLDFEANQIANRINTYDKQLMNLESTAVLKGVLEREKTMLRKRLEQKGKEALNAYKEKAAKTQRELITRYQDSRKNAIESRNKTEMRHKIKKVVSDLNQLLLHGSKERNVKLGLQQAVAAALDAINMDTVGADERIAKYNALIAKAKDPDVIESLKATRDRIQAQGDSLGDKLKALKDAYYDIQHGEEGKDYPAYFKDEAALIELRIQSVIKEVGNTSLRNMSLKQLSDVYDMYKMVLTTIQNANSVWKEGRAEDLQQNASAVMAELEKLKKLKGEGTRVGEWIRSFSWKEMIPFYAFERIGSKTFTSFFWETIKGQNTYANDVNEAKGFADNTREKYGYKKWDLDKLYEFKLTDGRTFQVTLKHMLSIYAYSKRDQALPHMSTGGFFFNDKSTFRKKGGILELIKRDDEGYKIDANILAEIKGAMTEEQLKYVDEMQEYLTKMGEKGNEVTRVLWGIDIFKEKVYFPLKSKDDFIKRSTETAQSVSLKNDGMTKETVPGASNPIVLEAFDDVWASHIDRMSQYHAFVIPIDNLNKIHQYGTWSGTSSMSVSTMLTARFGSAVNEYISQFIKDLNGNVVSQGAKNPLMGFFSKFKKTAVGASLSTVVQQPTAILRAMALVDAKYFVGKPNIIGLSKKWAELKKYAPIAIIKDIGGFDAGSGVQVSRWLNSDALTGIDKVMNKVDDISMKGAEFADQLGWSSIWEAVKRETKATTNLEVGSEAFLTKAGERFTEVVVKTQVYDSTLSRSGYMRSKSELVKMATAFMGEPTLSINMMFNAVVSVFRGGSKAQAARTLAYTYASIIAASAMASLIYALRDDDEDESYAEKYLQSFGGQFIDDVVLAPITSLPFVKDAVSIFQGWDVERTDVAIFKDIKDAFDGLDSENKSMYRKIEDFAGAIASAFGLPLKNVLRTGREIYNAFSFATDDITGGDLKGAFVEGITGKEKKKSDSLYEAIINGDDGRLEKYRAEYKTEEAFETAIRNALRENDSRIKEAAQARYDGDIAEYTRIAKEIIAEGNFSQDIVVGAINAEMNAIKRGENTETGETEDKDEVTSIYSASDVNNAFDNGDTATALQIIDDLINTKVANGKTEKEAKSSVRSSMTSYWKPLYKAAYQSGDATEMARIRKILYSSGLYGSSNDVIETVKGWLKN